MQLHNLTFKFYHQLQHFATLILQLFDLLPTNYGLLHLLLGGYELLVFKANLSALSTYHKYLHSSYLFRLI